MLARISNKQLIGPDLDTFDCGLNGRCKPFPVCRNPGNPQHPPST